MKKIREEAVKRQINVMGLIVTGTVGITIGCATICKVFRVLMERNYRENKEALDYYHVLNQWLYIIQKEKTVLEFFRKNNYKTVAIYGVKEITERLLDDLKNSKIIVKCIIDQNEIYMSNNIPFLHQYISLPDVDVVIVASYDFNKIKSKLKVREYTEIISIEDVVYSIQ